MLNVIHVCFKHTIPKAKAHGLSVSFDLLKKKRNITEVVIFMKLS